MGSQEEDSGGEVAALSTHILHRPPPSDLTFPSLVLVGLKPSRGAPGAVLTGLVHESRGHVGAGTCVGVSLRQHVRQFTPALETRVGTCFGSEEDTTLSDLFASLRVRRCQLAGCVRTGARLTVLGFLGDRAPRGGRGGRACDPAPSGDSAPAQGDTNHCPSSRGENATVFRLGLDR